MESTFPDGSNVFAKQDENARLIWLKGEKSTREDEVKNDQHDAGCDHGTSGNPCGNRPDAAVTINPMERTHMASTMNSQSHPF